MSEVTTNVTAPASAPADSAPANSTQTQNQEPGAQDTTAAQAALKKKFKIKVDGEEFEEELDLNDEEGVKRRLQMARAADKRMNEARDTKKKAFDIINALEKDPEGFLARHPRGREIAEAILLKQIKEEMIPPEEKERMKRESDLERRERLIAEKEKADQTKAQEALETKVAQDIQKVIIDAMEVSGLPKSKHLVKRMADLYSKNLSYGIELTPQQLAGELKNELTTMFKAIAGDSEGDHLIEMFGPEIANKIRKSDLKRLQEKQGQVFQRRESRTETVRAPESSKRPMSIEEWKEEINRRIKE